jgi:putative proteasome-type protease
MTFCLGITVEQGLIGIADTRLLSGNESMVAKKVATYQGPGFCFCVMNSGLRSLRDKILLRFEETFARSGNHRDRLSKMVDVYSRQVRSVVEEDREALEAAKLPSNIYSLVGGQMAMDTSHRLFLIYPEGNWVEIGPDTPYQIIGASGFGKPILERSVTHSDSMSYAFKVGILAFDATRLCAADVDFPIDVLLYQKDSFAMIEHRYYREDLSKISNWWQERMRRAVQELPSEWVDSAFSKLTRQTAISL